MISLNTHGDAPNHGGTLTITEPATITFRLVNGHLVVTAYHGTPANDGDTLEDVAGAYDTANPSNTNWSSHKP